MTMGEAISLLIPASVGELIDKITILEIKQRRINEQCGSELVEEKSYAAY